MNFNSIIKVIIIFFEIFASIISIYSLTTVYKLYKTTLLFYFLIYNVILSIFTIMHFLKFIKDIINDVYNDVIFIKIKVFLMVISFIWSIVILENTELINFYLDNFPKVYLSFINYFVLSSLSILHVIYKIIKYHYDMKKQNVIDYTIISKIDEEIMYDSEDELIELIKQ